MISVTTLKLVLLLLAADEDRGPLQRREYHPGAVMPTAHVDADADTTQTIFLCSSACIRSSKFSLQTQKYYC